MSIIHTAGDVEGLMQKCSRCGAVLQDYTNTLSVGEWFPSWWAGNVVVGQGFSAATDEPANCEAVEHSLQTDVAYWTCQTCEWQNKPIWDICLGCGTPRR